MLWIALLACGTPERTDPPEPPAEVLEVSRPPAAVARLTDAQWRKSVADLLDVAYTGPLPDDYVLHGHASIGAATVSTGPLDLERYDAAAWAVADAALADPEAREARLGCDEAAPGCLRPWAADLAGRAWRRHPEVAELDALMGIAAPLLPLDEPGLAARAVAAAVLSSPYFLYRIETGAPTLDGTWRYTDQELAARLSLVLTRTGPDAPLREAAEAGALQDPSALRAQVERLLATPAGRETVTAFWDEVFDLRQLHESTKDQALFPNFDEALREAMVREVEWLLLDVTYDRDVDVREVLTSTRTFVDEALAGIYGIDAVGETELPPERGGLLGRAALAAIYSHPAINSPTRRGKFVRTHLLCQTVQSPPPGLIASIDDVAPGESLRDRLAQHALDPACSGCHEAIDPPGFGMENLDPVGRWRNLDGLKPIDASGDLDGVPFVGVAELGAAVADHPDFPGCLAIDLWRYATGQPETPEELDDIGALADRMTAGSWRWKDLLIDLLVSDAFRGPAAGEVAAPPEACNGQDDDDDGEADEIERACEGGTQRCVSGAWAACEVAP